ncbi:MAG: hypothetical protein DME22_21810, partial [Verrucomicrobia bacterium]
MELAGTGTYKDPSRFSDKFQVPALKTSGGLCTMRLVVANKYRGISFADTGLLDELGLETLAPTPAKG